MLALKTDIANLSRLDKEKYKTMIRDERKLLKRYMSREAA